MPNDNLSTTHGDLFFESLVNSYVANNPRFLRRDWLAEEVKTRIAEPDCRFVLLTAEPGAGKTAFMAQLANDHPTWLRYFIRRDQRTPLGDVDVISFLLRIGYQLAALQPDLFTKERVQLSVEQNFGDVEERGEVVGAEIKRILASPFYQTAVKIRQYVERNAGRIVGLKLEELVIETRQLKWSDLQYMALIDPARALLDRDPAAQIVILVDALDEIRYHDSTEYDILKWLTNCPELPPNVHFVLSSRPPDDALKVFCEKQAPSLRRLALTPDDQRVQSDVETYARRLATRPDVATELVQLNIDTNAFVAQVADKANGNIGYLDAVERAIDAAFARPNGVDRASLDALLKLRQLPNELGALYGFFLRQIKTGIPGKVRLTDPDTGELCSVLLWPEVYSRILGVLAVALAPLRLDHIMSLGSIKIGREYTIEAMNSLVQFLDTEQGGYRLYHATLPEFLTAPSTREQAETTDLWIDASDWNQQIADYYWRTYRQDWRQCDTYGHNSLAVHMARSGQPDRLSELIDQDWMAARFEGGGYTYDGFAADVMVAWEQGRKETLRQIDSGEDPAYIVDYIRYALIHTSVNALSANCEPALIAKAVELDLWSVERSFSVTRKIPNPLRRAATWAALLELKRLSQSQQKLAYEEALVASLDIHKDNVDLHWNVDWWTATLAALAPQLTKEQQQQLLATARAIDTELLAKALVALAPYMTDELLLDSLAAAREIEDRVYRAEVLAALAPRMVAEERKEVLWLTLEVMHTINDEFMCSDILTSVGQYLTDELFYDGFVMALGINDKQSRESALTALLPSLANGELRQALAVAQGFGADAYRARFLTFLAPKLMGELAKEGLAVVRTIHDNEYRAEALAAFVPQLEGEEQSQAVSEALSAAQTIEPPWVRLRVLNSLIPYLANEARDTIQREMVAATQNLIPHDRAQLLVDMLPQLSGELLNQAVTAGLAAVDSIEWLPTRIEDLRPFMPYLQDNARHRRLKQELKTAMACKDGTVRVPVFVALAPLLTGADKEMALREGLRGVLALPVVTYRMQLLTELLPHITSELLQNVLVTMQTIEDEASCAGALSSLASSLTAASRELVLQGAVAAAQRIRNEWDRTFALTDLAPMLTGDLAREGLNAAQTIDDPMYRAQALAALSPMLTIETRNLVLRQSLKVVHGIKDKYDRAVALADLASQLMGDARDSALREGLRSACAIGSWKSKNAESFMKFARREQYRAQALVALAPQLTGELLRKGLATAKAISNEEYRAQALVALAPHLTGELLQEGLAVTQAIDKQYRTRALAALAPQLTGEAREDLLREALALALVIDIDEDRTRNLAALAPQLTGKLLRKGLAAAKAISNEEYRAQALAALAPQLTGNLLAQGLAAAKAISNEEYRAQALAALAPQLTGNLLAQGLAAVQIISDDLDRLRALVAFLPVAPERNVLLISIRQAMVDQMWNRLPQGTRSEVLRFCSDGQIFVPPILPPEILASIADHIVEICQKWKWF